MDHDESPPSFQFYPRDFLASSAVARMTHEALGGYIRLLCHAWMSEEAGVLEDDDASLAALSGLGAVRWDTCKESIRRAFKQTSREGRRVLVQKRMMQERAAQKRRHEQAVEGGRARISGATRSPSGLVLPIQPEASRDPGPASASASASALEDRVKRRSTRAKHPRAPRTPVTTITPEQRQAAARRYGLELAVVDSLADRIEAEAHAGKYVSAPGALHTFCRNEIRFNAERAARNGQDQPSGSRVNCRNCGFGPLIPQHAAKGLCAQCLIQGGVGYDEPN